MAKTDKFPLAAYGWPYCVATLVAAVVASGVGVWWLAAPLWALCAFVAFFFRDPARAAVSAANQVLSPADGTVVYVGPAEHQALPGGQATLVSIFMSLFNVHVNRLPLDGQVKALRHIDGGFVRADLAKASHENERNEVVIETADGQIIVVVQVAGLVARRIECELAPEQMVQKGARYGMIRFGSRLDVYLPPAAKATVSKGQKTRAGVTIIGEL